MLTLADKASLVSKWNALLHAKGALMVMSVGCFSTLALFFVSSLGAKLAFSPYWATNVAAFFTISSTALRFFLLRHGWAGVSVREVASLSSHLRGQALSDLSRRELEFDASHEDDEEYWGGERSRTASERFLDEVVQAKLLCIATEQGFVSWAQVGAALEERFHQPASSLIEWMFVGRGGEALATAQHWSAICTPPARLDAATPSASSSVQVRRL